MIPPQFDYHAPGSLDEALGLLGSLDDPKVMSGGQSLLPMLKLRLASPANIVDIGRIPGLDTLAEEDGFLRIGALVTETQLEQSAVVAERYPILLDTAKVIADPLVRNRATICGNIAHGDPANDHPATMLALGAQVVATGPDGARTIDVGEFFFGLFMTALGEDEILTEIRIPAPAAEQRRRLRQARTQGGRLRRRRIRRSARPGRRRHRGERGHRAHQPGHRPHPRDRRGGSAHRRRLPTDDTIAAAAQAAADATEPIPDRRGSIEYKQNMARVLTARAIRKALARAGG